MCISFTVSYGCMSRYCINQAGSFHCSCDDHSGYRLSTDGTTCEGIHNECACIYVCVCRQTDRLADKHTITLRHMHEELMNTSRSMSVCTLHYLSLKGVEPLMMFLRIGTCVTIIDLTFIEPHAIKHAVYTCKAVL